MMIAWYFATALSKRWEESIVYLENKSLEKWVHNKIIQKAIESFRIDKSKKQYLRIAAIILLPDDTQIPKSHRQCK